MRFLRQWFRLLLVGDEWGDRVVRWLPLVAAVGLGVSLSEPLEGAAKAFGQTVPFKLPVGIAAGVAVGVIWLSGTAGAAWERSRLPSQTPLYIRHVDALQAFAAKTKRQIEEQDARIDQSKAIGRHFRSHFPDIGRQFDRWGSTGHAEKERRFWELMRVEETRLDLSMQAVNLLAALAQGSVAFDDVTWELDNTTVTARNPIWGYWQVATRPQGAAFADIVESVRDSAARLRALPAVTDYIETTRQVEVLRAALLDALDTVMTNQQPRGHCDGCPRG